MHITVRAQSVRWISAVITFIVAGVALVFGPTHLEYPAPFYISHLAAVIDTVILAAMFYASLGLIIGKRAAWYMAVVILALASVWESVESRAFISQLSIFPLIALVIVSLTYRYYPLANGPLGINTALRRAFVFTLLSTGIGCAAFFLLSVTEHHPFRLLPSILESLERMYSLHTTLGSFHHAPPTHVAGHLLLLVLGGVNYLLITLALLKPVADTFKHTSTSHRHALELIRRFSTSSEDYFKYFPHDKSYFFSTDRQGCIAYSVHGNTCVMLADPIAADQAKRLQLLKEFMDFSSSHGWQLAAVAVEPASLPLYDTVGLRTIKIGENAIIDLAAYCAQKRDKKTRNIMNRFLKAGYQVTLEKPEHTAAVLNELKEVSDSWLTQGRRKEHQFAMGYFAEHYLQECSLLIVRDATQRIVAFVNLQPNFSPAPRASIDLMRVRPDAPTNTMDFLFISLIELLHANGWQSLDMGLAPLSGLEQAEHLNERGLHVMYRYTNKWFAFRGLRRFKDKFQPLWEPRFLAYSGSSSRLPAIALAINELLRYKN